MKTELFKKYRKAIMNLSVEGFTDELLIDRDGKLSIYYAPFEYTNLNAKVVIVGITPGYTQMINALQEAKNQLLNGADDESVLCRSKLVGAFSGAMRKNLVDELDHIGINQWLGIETTGLLFGKMSHLVQTASVLCFPVFVDGENYNGSPNMLKHQLLKQHVMEYFGKSASQLKDAIFIPLGEKPSGALNFLVSEGLIEKDRVLNGLPHPSGANNERISYFVGKKDRKALSQKTNADKLDFSKSRIMSQMASIMSTY